MSLSLSYKSYAQGDRANQGRHRAAHSQPELTTPIGSLSAGDTLSSIVASHLNKSDNRTAQTRT